MIGQGLVFLALSILSLVLGRLMVGRAYCNRPGCEFAAWHHHHLAHLHDGWPVKHGPEPRRAKQASALIFAALPLSALAVLALVSHLILEVTR